MRLSTKWKAYLLKSPAFLLLTGPSGAAMQQQQQQRSGRLPPPGVGRGKRVRPTAIAPSGQDEAITSSSWGGLAGWSRLLRRRLAVTCRPRNLARLLGAALVACLLLLLVTKGFGARRRGAACKCTKFTYSLCQPHEGRCGAGTKRAICQQRRCRPRRKLVRCALPCDGASAAAAAGGFIESSGAAVVDGSAKQHQLQAPQPDVSCVYAPRRQSRWTQCINSVGQGQQEHRSRLLFLQSGTAADCPATKTERRPCSRSSAASRQSKGCIYESRGIWSTCNRARNQIVNTRRLLDGTADNCPAELVETMRCLKRDGTLKCLHSKWTKWSRCDGGSRRKTRTLVQGVACDGATTIEQNCVIMYPFVPDDSDTLL